MARAREAELLAELAVLERELGAYPDQEERLSHVDREIRALENNYDQLVSGYAASDIQNASAPSWNVRIFAVASEPFRFHTGDLIRTLVVPLFALVVGFGLAFIVDALDPSVKTAREAERIFEAPVIASVARIGRK